MAAVTHLKIFISCPGDVEPEKNLIKNACADIEKVFRNQGRDLYLEVYDWKELNRQFGPRPQEIINEVYAGYDVYIGILWNRFGSPPGTVNPNTGEDFDSGTEEEFIIAIDRWKAGEKLAIYFFFKEMNIPDIYTMEQQMLILKFRKEIENRHSWSDTCPKTDNGVELLRKVNKLLLSEVLKKEQSTQISHTQSIIQLISVTRPSAPPPISLSIGIPAVSSPMARQLIALGDLEGRRFPVFEEPKTALLKDIVNQERLVVLLGNPGSGKSAELSLLTERFQAENSPFIPLYRKLNTYVDQDVSAFLPQDWEAYPQDTLIVILDGLDEVQPQYFNTAVRKLQSFAENHRDIRIVVSCRTNFYQLPSQNASGTLPAFSIYIFKQLDTKQQKAYAARYLGTDGSAFMTEVQTQRLSELAIQPFFLRSMLEVFKSKKTLGGGKGKLLERLIDDRFSHDLKHYQSTLSLRNRKKRILEMLEKIAMVMEYQGRNFIADDDLQAIISEPEHLELLRFSTCFNTHLLQGILVWTFEHNNIQEYLAARALSRLGYRKIKAFIAFDGKKLKPSWANTLFFLISIAAEPLRNSLINWLQRDEQETLVRMERENVEPKLRLKIFIAIFNKYKKENIWLRSNKFSTEELARFGSSPEAFDFLLQELSADSSTRFVRFNALNMLEHFTLNTAQRQRLKNPLLELIRKLQADHYLVYSLMATLTRLKLAGHQEIYELMTLMGERENQYIRAGFYALIAEANLQDQYLDYLLEGIGISEKETGDRLDVNLMDESIRLKIALEQVESFYGVSKMLVHFRNAYDRSLLRYFDREDVVKAMVNHAVALYATEPNIFEEVMSTYKKYGRSSMVKDVEQYAQFFKATKTRVEAVDVLLADQQFQSHERAMLVAPLLDEQIADKLISDYNNHELNNEQLRSIYYQMDWASVHLPDPSAMAYFQEKIIKETNIDLGEAKAVEYRRIRKERERQSFELYFQPEQMLEQVKTVFEQEKWTMLHWNELWATRKNGVDDLENNLLESVFNLLVDFTRQDRAITLDELLKWASEENEFLNYRIGKIASALQGKADILLTDAQKQLIQTWVSARIKTTDVTKAITVNESYTRQFSVSETARDIWYFVSQQGITLPEDKLLDFTLFDEIKTGLAGKGLNFELIENLVGSVKLAKRVLKNLKNPISYDGTWKNNCFYAIEKGLAGAALLILKGLQDENKSDYIRKEVLKAYYESTVDTEGLMNLLPTVGRELRWTIVDLIRNQRAIKEPLTEWLLKILRREPPAIVEQLQAARYLTELGVMEGFNFYADYLLEKRDPSYDHYFRSSFLRTLVDPAAIPQLMQLLEMAKQPEFVGDNFNRLDNYVTDALTGIGLSSEDNLKLVKAAMETFIKTHPKIEHVQFLRVLIHDMEFRFYMNRSQRYTLQEAIIEVEKTGWTI